MQLIDKGTSKFVFLKTFYGLPRKIYIMTKTSTTKTQSVESPMGVPIGIV